MFCIQHVYKKTSILKFKTQPIKKEKQSSFEIFYSQLFNLSSHLLLFQISKPLQCIYSEVQ